jgi:hypothetical protein
MVGLAPGLGLVSGSPDPLCGHTSRLCLLGISLARFVGSVSWGEQIDPRMT